MSRPNHRLGRGLASLIPDTALDHVDTTTTRQKGVRQVPLDEIKPNPEQPRTAFEPVALEALSDSIRRYGILSPLVVRRSQGRYILIAGERRFRAAALAGLTEVPVVLRDAPDAKEQLELALIENLQREDLDPVETAKGYARLMEEYHLTQDQVAKRMGRDRSTIANALRLLKLPDFVLAAVRDRRISAGHARTLVPLAETPEELRQVLAKVLAQKLSVRATERLVSSITATPKPIRTANKERRDNTFDYATRLLTEALQTSVQIKDKGGKGRIVIDYTNPEELERLIQTLRVGS